MPRSWWVSLAVSGSTASGLLLTNVTASFAYRGKSMKRRHPSARALLGRRIPLAVLSLVLLAGCEQNSFVPPPPPKVEVALPVQRNVTRFLEATGNTAP